MSTPPLNLPPVATVDEAIQRMQDMRDFLPKRNGLANFNLVYLEVTMAVDGRIGSGFFADDRFLTALDVCFVNRYFDAVRSWTDHGPTPRSWRVLLEDQDDRAVHPAQFAVAGMNAHINFDLPFAVINSCRALGEDVGTGAHRADFDKMNEVLHEMEPALRQRFQPGCFDPVDRDLPDLAKVEDVLANFSIDRAREHAWDEALFMDELSGRPAEMAADLLDRMVSAFGHGLLIHL